MMQSIVLAASLVTAATLSVWRLRPLHPAQLWALSWAVAAPLYAVRLLPYRYVSWTTVVITLAASAAFIGCSVAGDRLTRQVAVAPERRVGADPAVLRAAARSTVALTAILLAAFLVQATSRNGLSAVLLNSSSVRAAVQAGAMALTIKYVYAALAATVLCAIAAGSALMSRRRWLTAALLSASSIYFSTARSTLVLAAVAGVVAYLLARRRPLSRMRLLAGTAVVGLLTLVVFLGGGRLVGKTFENNPSLQTVPSTFTKHREWSVFALPYQYASAPVAALDIQVETATTWGSTHGCAALSEECRVLHLLGFDLHGASRVRPFTGEPLPWNTYTALDVPLLDGGLALAIPIIGLIGFVLGSFWSLAARGSLAAVSTYAILATAAITSSGSFNFTAPHLVGAVLIALASTSLVRLFRRVSGRRGVAVREI